MKFPTNYVVNVPLPHSFFMKMIITPGQEPTLVLFTPDGSPDCVLLNEPGLTFSEIIQNARVHVLGLTKLLADIEKLED